MEGNVLKVKNLKWKVCFPDCHENRRFSRSDEYSYCEALAEAIQKIYVSRESILKMEN